MADNAQKGAFDMSVFDMSSLTAMGAAYQRKLLEFSQTNAQSAMQFATSLANCRSPVDFMNATQEYTRRQMEAVQQQTKELMELAKSTGSAASPSEPTP
jgi:hypothetical protein